MKREKFIQLLRREARAIGRDFRVDKVAGKGSHYRVHIGNQVSTVKSGELKPGYVKLIRRQLGLK